MSRPALSLGCLLADVHLAVVKLDLATRLALDGIARHVIIPPAITVPQATRVVGRHCIVRAATIRGDRCGSWLRENADEPRIRRIVFSIGFSRKRPPVQLFFTSTKSRQSFYAQVQLQSYHAASRPGFPNSTTVVRATCVVTCTRVVRRGGADSGRRADCGPPVLSARDASTRLGTAACDRRGDHRALDNRR